MTAPYHRRHTRQTSDLKVLPVKKEPTPLAKMLKRRLYANQKKFAFVTETECSLSAVNDTTFIKMVWSPDFKMEVSTKPAKSCDWRSKVHKDEAAILAAFNEILPEGVTQ